MTNEKTTRQGTNKINGSLGVGFKALTSGGGGKQFYVLQNKTATKNHPQGATKEIIVDYLELGRSDTCGMSYPDCPTVSRKHAAIVKDGNSWLLRNLSQINPTLINGRPVENQFFLSNGDEIQLSLEGPKLGFFTSSANIVSSIPLTRRLSLFRQQALRPYKYALTILTILLLFSVTFLSYSIFKLQKDLSFSNEQLVKARNEFQKGNQELSERFKDSIIKVSSENNKLKEQLFETLHEEILKYKPVPPINTIQVAEHKENQSITQTNQIGVSLNKAGRDVYLISLEKIKIQFQDKSGEINCNDTLIWTGTGFLLNDGRFVTARHVIEPWMFNALYSDNYLRWFNIIKNLGGSVEAVYSAVSQEGAKITLNSSEFVINNSNEQTTAITDKEGNSWTISDLGFNNGTDWAFVQLSNKGNLVIADSIEDRIRTAEKLHVLGYPSGMISEKNNHERPVYCEASIARDGIISGMIEISNNCTDHGNSGGPAFLHYHDSMKVVGVISTGMTENKRLGGIVPITAINKNVKR